jgi:hypothetical protein
MIRPYRNKAVGGFADAVAEYDVATGTAIKSGALVKITSNKVVLATTTETTDILGVAAESHSGSVSAINPRENGTKIVVYDSPLTVYKVAAPKITATGGMTTTIVSTDIDSSGTDDSLNSGYAKLISKAAASTNTDAVGTIYTISDYVTSTDTLTINEAGGAVTAGDEFAIFPPFDFTDFSYVATLDSLVLSNDGQGILKCVGYDTDEEAVLLYAVGHKYGNENL